MIKTYTGIMSDNGCIGSLEGVLNELKRRGHNVNVITNPKGAAADNYKGPLDRVDQLDSGSIALLDLPDFSLELVGNAGVKAVQVRGAPDWNDPRAKKATKLSNIEAICVLHQAPHELGNPRIITTGLPVMDKAAINVGGINTDEVRARLGEPAAHLVSVALPKDKPNCLRMLDEVAKGCLNHRIGIIRSHPDLLKFDKPGFDEVKKRVDQMRTQHAILLPLDEANSQITSDESMALARGTHNYFIGTHDTTMTWQSVAGGVTNVFVLPKEKDDGSWENSAPIITSNFGVAFHGTLGMHRRISNLMTGGALEKICEVAEAA